VKSLSFFLPTSSHHLSIKHSTCKQLKTVGREIRGFADMVFVTTNILASCILGVILCEYRTLFIYMDVCDLKVALMWSYKFILCTIWQKFARSW